MCCFSTRVKPTFLHQAIWLSGGDFVCKKNPDLGGNSHRGRFYCRKGTANKLFLPISRIAGAQPSSVSGFGRLTCLWKAWKGARKECARAGRSVSSPVFLGDQPGLLRVLSGWPWRPSQTLRPLLHPCSHNDLRRDPRGVCHFKPDI